MNRQLKYTTFATRYQQWMRPYWDNGGCVDFGGCHVDDGGVELVADGACGDAN